MDSRCYLIMRSWPPLAIAVGMECLEVAAPYSDWELGFSLLTWRDVTYELKKCTIAKQHLKNGNQVLLYLMLATPPGFCGS